MGSAQSREAQRAPLLLPDDDSGDEHRALSDVIDRVEWRRVATGIQMRCVVADGWLGTPLTYRLLPDTDFDGSWTWYSSEHALAGMTMEVCRDGAIVPLAAGVLGRDVRMRENGYAS